MTAKRWGLIVEQNLGFGSQKRVWAPHVLDHVDGTREEAMAELLGRARRFSPMHPANPKRTRLYADGDGCLLVVEGVWQEFHCRFTVAELLYDSDPPPPAPAPPAEPARSEPAPPPPAPSPPPPEPPRPWDADVPEVPTWLGRDDLPGSR
ncbi:hypothetical protein ACFY7Z_18960 [Streptomyces sp. NPDC012623]|uniref:hypothetical protein n=1 Tax=unclassified Streptomyces TaxID=2593676 RepID=UPI00367D342D